MKVDATWGIMEIRSMEPLGRKQTKEPEKLQYFLRSLAALAVDTDWEPG